MPKINPDDFVIIQYSRDDVEFVYRSDYHNALAQSGLKRLEEIEVQGVSTATYTGRGVADFTNTLSECRNPGQVRETDDTQGYDVIDIRGHDRVVVTERTNRDAIISSDDLEEQLFEERLGIITELRLTAEIQDPDGDLPKAIQQLEDDWRDGNVDLTVADFEELFRQDRALRRTPKNALQSLTDIRDRKRERNHQQFVDFVRERRASRDLGR